MEEGGWVVALCNVVGKPIPSEARELMVRVNLPPVMKQYLRQEVEDQDFVHLFKSAVGDDICQKKRAMDDVACFFHVRVPWNGRPFVRTTPNFSLNARCLSMKSFTLFQFRGKSSKISHKLEISRPISFVRVITLLTSTTLEQWIPGKGISQW